MGDASILEKIDGLNLEERDASNYQQTESGITREIKSDNGQLKQESTPDQLSFGSNINATFMDRYDSTAEHCRPLPKTEQGKFQDTITILVEYEYAIKSSLPHFIANMPWRLFVKSTNPIKNGVKNYLSVYLDCNSESDSILWSCGADVEFRVLSKDPKREPYKRNYSLEYKHGATRWGIPQFMEWSELVDAQNEYIHNREATIEVQVTIRTMIGYRGYSEFDYDFNVPGSKSDVILAVEGKRVRVCKHYLSVYSPVFHAMFFSEFSERNQKEIILADLKMEEFLTLLHAIYPMHKPVTKDNVDFLLKLGDRFEIQFITDECERFLIRTKAVSKSKKFLFADQYCLAKLQDVCMKTIKNIYDLKLLKEQEEYTEFTPETKAALLDRLLKLE